MQINQISDKAKFYGINELQLSLNGKVKIMIIVIKLYFYKREISKKLIRLSSMSCLRHLLVLIRLRSYVPYFTFKIVKGVK